MQPPRAVVGSDGSEFELVCAGVSASRPLHCLDDPGAVVGMYATDPKLRVAHPTLGWKTKNLFCATTDECEPRLVDVGFPEDCAHLLDEISIALLGGRNCFPENDRRGLFALRDVKCHALQK